LKTLTGDLAKITLSGNIYERLRRAHTLVNEVVVAANKVPLQEKKGPPNVHEKTETASQE